MPISLIYQQIFALLLLTTGSVFYQKINEAKCFFIFHRGIAGIVFFFSAGDSLTSLYLNRHEGEKDCPHKKQNRR